MHQRHGEMPVETLQQRIASLLAVVDSDMDVTAVPFRILPVDSQAFPLPPLDTDEGQRLLLGQIDDARLLVIDNVSTLMGSGSENDAEAWAPSQRLLLDLRRRGVAVLMVHHSGKAGTQRGTSRREDVLDTVVKLARPKDYVSEEGARFEVSFEKARGLAGGAVCPIEARLELDEMGRAAWTFAYAARRNEERAVEMLRQGMKPGNIAMELSVSRATVYRWRTKAIQNGQVKENKR